MARKAQKTGKISGGMIVRGINQTKGQPNEPSRRGFHLRIRAVAVGTGVGILACCLFLLLMAAIMASRHVPQSAVEPMALAALAAGAFVAGLACAGIAGRAGLLHGGACGLLLTAIICVAAAISSTSIIGVPMLFRGIFATLAAMLGGVIGVNTGRRKIRK